MLFAWAVDSEKSNFYPMSISSFSHTRTLEPNLCQKSIENWNLSRKANLSRFSWRWHVTFSQHAPWRSNGGLRRVPNDLRQFNFAFNRFARFVITSENDEWRFSPANCFRLLEFGWVVHSRVTKFVLMIPRNFSNQTCAVILRVYFHVLEQ